MKRLCVALLFIAVILPSGTWAKVYRYVDSTGQERFTNDLSTIPADSLSQVTEHDEIQSDESIPPAQFPTRISPVPPRVDTSYQKQALQRKKALEQEYKELLKEKEALDNDKSFQKRRKKRKYKHRPHIKELVKKEAQIIQRMAEIEKEL